MSVVFYVTLCLLYTAVQLVHGDPDGSEVYLNSFYVDEGEEIRQMAINGADVLVATDESLYRLSNDLSEEQRKLIVPAMGTRLLLATNSGSGHNVALICGMACRLVVADDIGRRVWPAVGSSPSPLVLNASATVKFTGLLRKGVRPERYELTYAQNDFIDRLRGGESVASRIVRGIIIRGRRNMPEGNPDRYEITASQIELDPNQEREFIHAFARGGFAYFISVMSFPSGLQARVARAYGSGSDDADARNGTFCSYIELALQCGDLNAVPTAATFISAPNAFGADAIVLAASMARLSEVRNRLCAFNLTRIDEMMDEKMLECADGIGMKGLARNAAQQTVCTPLQVYTVTVHACMQKPAFTYDCGSSCTLYFEAQFVDLQVQCVTYVRLSNIRRL